MASTMEYNRPHNAPLRLLKHNKTIQSWTYCARRRRNPIKALAMSSFLLPGHRTLHPRFPYRGYFRLQRKHHFAFPQTRKRILVKLITLVSTRAKTYPEVPEASNMVKTGRITKMRVPQHQRAPLKVCVYSNWLRIYPSDPLLFLAVFETHP
jgi:hypothetical protein